MSTPIDPLRPPREPAAEVAFTPSWVFRLYPRDASLVLRALGGRLRDDDDIKAAAELGDRLTTLRAKAVEGFERTYTVAAEHVRAKGEPK
jgi:hypothetical protein